MSAALQMTVFPLTQEEEEMVQERLNDIEKDLRALIQAVADLRALEEATRQAVNAGFLRINGRIDKNAERINGLERLASTVSWTTKALLAIGAALAWIFEGPIKDAVVKILGIKP